MADIGVDMADVQKGVDGSSVQGALPYKDLVAQGIKFVILKACQGNDGFDPWFERNMKAGFDAGLEVFAYCFFYPLPVTKPSRDPKYQAELFVNSVYRFPEMRGRPIFLDYEWPEAENWAKWGCTAPQINDSLRENAAEVWRLAGAAPVLYTYDYWWKAVAASADVSWASAYPLWMAWYGSTLKVPHPWTKALFWQYDGNGGERLPNGIDADFNYFEGTEDELRTFARGPRPVDSVEGKAAVDEVARSANQG